MLHIIDHGSRLSASTIIPNKNPQNIVKGIFKIWIAVHRSVEKFLTDNRGEFANDHFVQLCESFCIIIKSYQLVISINPKFSPMYSAKAITPITSNPTDKAIVNI